MKKLIQTILVGAIMLLFTIADVRAQDDVTYIEESPVDSSHMEQTINLGEEQVAEKSNQNYFLFGVLAVIVVAGLLFVVKKKKK